MAYFIIFVTFFSSLFYSYRFKKKHDILLVLPIFYNVIVLYTILGTMVLEYAKDTPFSLYYLVSDDSLYNASFMFIFSSFCFYIGTTLVRRARRPKNKLEVNRVVVKAQKFLVCAILVVYLIYILGYGAESLVFRNGYIDANDVRNKSILTLFFALSPVVTLLIPFIKSSSLRYFVYLVCFLVLFSSSARAMILIPALYIVGSFVRDKKLGSKILLTNAALIIVCLIFALQIRYYPFHGLIPNLSALFTRGVDLDYLLVGLNYGLSFSLFGTAYILENFTHDSMAFFASINPLPSRFVNIAHMVEAQRMLGTSPMSALSALSLYGNMGVASFYFVTGFFYSFILKKLDNKTVLYFGVVGMVMLFTLFSVQYNLRGSSRFFYYTILIFGVYMVAKRVRIKKTRSL